MATTKILSLSMKYIYLLNKEREVLDYLPVEDSEEAVYWSVGAIDYFRKKGKIKELQVSKIISFIKQSLANFTESVDNEIDLSVHSLPYFLIYTTKAIA